MSSYDEVVAAATVGLAQRPLTVTELAGPARAHSDVLAEEPAAAVLDAAALLDAGRRAGGLLLAPCPPREPAPTDDAAELNRVASALVRDVLATTDRELLAELLTVAAGAGVRIAAPDLPALLTVAAQHRSLRAPVAAVLGQRGYWLAAQHPEWRRVIDATVAAVPADAWATGRLAERVAWLAEFRQRDPAGARDALASGWSQETGDDRVVLLGALGAGLGPADEPFLEAALDDRKAEVREEARRLLARLPESAFVTRAADRARGVLRRERRRLVVTLPPPPDAAARRDGLTGQPPHTAIGASAWHLFQIVARAPLAVWAATLDRAPAELAAAPITGEFGAGESGAGESGAGEFADEVRAGWRAAAVREGDAEWARALLAVPVDSPLAVPDAQLAGLLQVSDRVTRAITVLAGERPGKIADIAVCPAPWPTQLTDAALGYLGAQVRSAVPTAPGELPHLLARRSDLADRRDLPGWLRELADRFRIRTASVPAAGRWAAPLDRAAADLDLRRRFARELP